MSKVYTRFQTKTAQKPYPMGGGGTYLNMANIRDCLSPPPPPRGFEPSPELSPLGHPSKMSEKHPRPCHMPIAPAQPQLSSDERAGSIVGVKPE